MLHAGKISVASLKKSYVNSDNWELSTSIKTLSLTYLGHSHGQYVAQGYIDLVVKTLYYVHYNR